MINFLNEVSAWEQYELLIDSSIFSKDIVMKAAYTFLDKAYFFFKIDEKENIIIQVTKKSWIKKDLKEIVWDFSDELLSVYLRNKLEQENKIIRETIVSAAISNSLDSVNYVEINTEEWENQKQNQIDFDKDIDEILKEIENDPDLKIDEAEIEKILREIEEETGSLKDNKPSITLNPNAIQDVKKKFQNK